MTRTVTAGCIALLFSAAAPLEGQDRAAGSEPAAGPRTGAARQDTVPADTARGPRLRLHGDLLSRLPLDDAARLLEFFPGFMRTPSRDVIYRSEPAHIGLYVDGVPASSLTRPGRGLLPSLNALESVSLTSGGVSAARMGASVIDYVTHSGGTEWAGSARVLSDALAPGTWNQHLTRIDLGASGPVPGISGLRLALSGQLFGQRYRQLPGSTSGTVYLASGVDTTITVAGSQGPVDVVVPQYVPWSYDQLPLGNTDRSDLTAGLTYSRSGGEYGLRYYRTGVQDVSHALDQLYNQDAWRGTEDVAQMVSLSARRPLPLGLMGDVVVSHQRYDATQGILDPRWASMNSHPSFGITTGGLGFLADRDDYPVTDPILIALRSGVLPDNTVTFTTMDSNLLPMRQGVAGLNQPLRLNPYGMRTGFPTSGVGDAGDAAVSWSTERRWYGRAALTREFGAHSVQVGGELDRTSVESLTLPLAEGTPDAFREKPSVSAVFVQGATSVQGVRVEAGVRVEHHGSDAALPLIPGFVTNVPDSLRGDAYMLRPGSEPWQERLEPVVDCGGTTPVCRNNFVPVASHTLVSPRVSARYDAGRFSARASYGSYVQPLRLTGIAFTDLSATNTNAVFPRETDPVREDVAELGMRVRTLGASWIDFQLFRLDVANPVVYRRTPFTNPVGGAPLFLITPGNTRSRVTTGVELTVLQHVGSWAGILANVAVSHTDNSTEDVEKPSDPVRTAGIVWFDLGEVGGPYAVTRVLDDLTVHLTASWSQVGRYTRLVNIGRGELAGRLNEFVNGGTLAEPLYASRLPSRTELDLRFAKGFRIGGTTARFVADLRNPLGFENVHTIFAETGATENEAYQDFLTRSALLDYTGSGTFNDIVIDDFPENDVNRYMMRRAEQRFGNGDGIYTTGEMTAAVNSYLDLMQGRQWLVDSARELRLGIEVSF